MSGSGRKSSYRKTVTDQVLYGEPEPKEDEQIVRVVALRGSNLFQVECSDGQIEVAMLPHRYQKLIWIKRGDFLIVSGATGDFTTAEGKKGAVKYMIEHILYKDQVKHLKQKGLWPVSFQDTVKPDPRASKSFCSISTAEESEDEDEDDDSDLFVNRNRSGGMISESESEDEEDF